MDYHVQVACDWFNPYGKGDPATQPSTETHAGADGNLCLPDSFEVTPKDDAS